MKLQHSEITYAIIMGIKQMGRDSFGGVDFLHVFLLVYKLMLVYTLVDLNLLRYLFLYDSLT